MMTQRDGMQLKKHWVTIDELVPENDPLRAIEEAVDFTFIYEEVRELYCADNGRPGIDPVVLIKYLLIGFLCGIVSEREIERQIRVNMAYRWFLGLDIGERGPDHSTISQNRRRRFNGKEVYRRLFERILAICMEKGLVDGKLILTDSTHVKANASARANIKVMAEKEAAWYMELLDKYEEKERRDLEEAGKIPAKRIRYKKKSGPKLVEKTVSTTDPEAGMLHRPGKPDGMHYLDHQSIDAKNGIIVDVAVTPANVTDASPYLDRVEYIQTEVGLTIEAVGADSAYDVSLVHQELSEKSIALYTPENNVETTYKAEFHKNDFEYQDDNDIFICPAGKHLALKRLERGECNVMREYRAERNDCQNCPFRDKCLAPSQTCRKIQVNIFESAVKQQHEKDGTPEHKRVLALRQIWCEGTFAAQKARHNLRRLYRRGLEAAEEHCLLAAMAINLKRMVKWAG